MWETLYDSFWDKLVRFCYKLTRDEAAAELAQLTGEPAATVRTRLHRIRRQLQQALKEE